MKKHAGKHDALMLNLFCSIFVLFLIDVPAQDEHAEIRAYKAYNAHIKIENSAGCTPNSGFNAVVSIGRLKADAISLGGLTIEVPASFCSTEHSAHVDFLTFRDFRVNGLTVEVEEFRSPFRFSKNVVVQLPNPAGIIIGGQNILKTAYRELVETRTEWSITGTVLVFGRFKKIGLNFKRVVPVKIDIKIKNPLLN